MSKILDNDNATFNHANICAVNQNNTYIGKELHQIKINLAENINVNQIGFYYKAISKYDYYYVELLDVNNLPIANSNYSFDIDSQESIDEDNSYTHMSLSVNNGTLRIP